jgi:hypothetical protein
MAGSTHSAIVLTDTIIVAVAQLVDDAQVERREPSHSDLAFHIQRNGLADGDPNQSGQPVGKAKRVRGVLNWAMEYEPLSGGAFVHSLIGVVRGHGGFREASPNYVGRQPIENAIAAFAEEGYELALDGQLRSKLLDNLSGAALTDALEAYVRRAKRGAEDAALVTGTGKDLLEAVAAHVHLERYGMKTSISNFPTLLGQVFLGLGLATPHDPHVPGDPPQKRIERAMYELACAVNQLRNKQGTGHGRPWLPTVSHAEARAAIEFMGIIGEYLLHVNRTKK